MTLKYPSSDWLMSCRPHWSKLRQREWSSLCTSRCSLYHIRSGSFLCPGSRKRLGRSGNPGNEINHTKLIQIQCIGDVDRTFHFSGYNPAHYYINNMIKALLFANNPTKLPITMIKCTSNLECFFNKRARCDVISIFLRRILVKHVIKFKRMFVPVL